MAEIARHTLARDFRRIDPRDRARGPGRGAAARAAGLSRGAVAKRAQRSSSARRRGPDRLARSPASTRRACQIGRERLAARTVLWAAGVRPRRSARTLGVAARPRGPRAGRARPERAGPPGGLRDRRPRGARAGRQAGARASRRPPCRWAGTPRANIARAVAARPLAPFRYRDKGSLATIGRSRGGRRSGALHLSGFIAWLAWLFDPHLLPDRLPQPARRAVRVGLGLRRPTSAARGSSSATGASGVAAPFRTRPQRPTEAQKPTSSPAVAWTSCSVLPVRNWSSADGRRDVDASPRARTGSSAPRRSGTRSRSRSGARRPT